MKTAGDRDVMKPRSPKANSLYIARLALLRTVRDLRLSVAAERPMTLPNCLRLCRRRLPAGGASEPEVVESLLQVYRQHQPFRRGPFVIGELGKE